MFRSTFLKALHDQRRSLPGWLASIGLIVLMYAAIWPSIRDQPSISDFLDQMPPAFRSLFATAGADMSTPVGYIQIEMMSFIGPILVIAYGVTRGADAVAGEEERHTLDLELSSPVGRSRLLVEKAAAMGAGTAVLAAAAGVALILEGRLFDMVLPVDTVTAAMVHLALLGMVFGMVALALGAVTGRSGLSRAVPAAVAVVAYLVNALGPLVSWLGPLRSLSPFYQYIGHDPLRTGISVPALLVATGTVLALGVGAVWAFRRRDVRG